MMTGFKGDESGRTTALLQLITMLYSSEAWAVRAEQILLFMNFDQKAIVAVTQIPSQFLKPMLLILLILLIFLIFLIIETHHPKLLPSKYSNWSFRASIHQSHTPFGRSRSPLDPLTP